MTTSLKTNGGKKLILNRAYKASPDYTALSKFKVGINQATPTVASTSLTRPVPITGTEVVNDCDDNTDFTAGTDTALSDNSTTKKEGDSSISLEKSGTSGTQASMSGAVTSRDFTSKDLFLWIYIEDKTDLVSSGNAVEIRYGSDSSNYYQYYIDIDDLSDGWNIFEKNSGEADNTVSSPTISACDYFAIYFNTDLAADTIAADRLLVDGIVLASSDDFTKAFAASYPQLDETNHEATIRCVLEETEANGHDISGFALINTDGTPIMGSVDEMTAESKDETDEFIWVIRERLL